MEKLEERLGYRFGNRKLLEEALTHKSYAHENSTTHNERLEFLGDSVLQLVISDALMTRYPDLAEGQLSKFRSVLVNENGLGVIAGKLHLGEYLRMGKGEASSGGAQRLSNLANAVEALFAAVYLDSKSQFGLGLVAQLILQWFEEQIQANESGFEQEDYKTRLQEFTQSRKMGEIKYVVTKEEGPDHDKTFHVELTIGGKPKGQGQGKSKKLAEQQAAFNALLSYKTT